MGSRQLRHEGDPRMIHADITLARRLESLICSEFRGLAAVGLQLARDAWCDLAVTEVAPGSGSQRNMEGLGFRIAYTHVEFAKPIGSTPAGAASGR